MDGLATISERQVGVRWLAKKKQKKTQQLTVKRMLMIISRTLVIFAHVPRSELAILLPLPENHACTCRMKDLRRIDKYN